MENKRDVRWLVRFNGRKIGASGIFYDIEIMVKALTPDEARKKVYEEYQDCKNFRFDPLWS